MLLSVRQLIVVSLHLVDHVSLPRAEYGFMVILIDSCSSELPEFLFMIQQMVSSASFPDCLEFASESNISSSVGLDVCLSRYPIYILFSSVEIMPRVSTILYLFVAYIDDITRPIVICNDKYKFVVYLYSFL